MHSPFCYEATNVNQALSTGLGWLADAGVREESRNGPVLVSPVPVCITYTRPWERVLFSPLRDVNPFFHLMEALWMMNGGHDVAWPTQFNSKFGQFSDDGRNFWGAYGYRWRGWFGYDQLFLIASELRKDPTSRRCVLSMWDGAKDLPKATGHRVSNHDTLIPGFAVGRDVPCNTQAYFDVRGGKLNMTVTNRSNDALWGAFGANAVHFSIMQEVLAAMVGVQVGVYHQFTNNLHVYTSVFGVDGLGALAVDAERHDYYSTDGVAGLPVVAGDSNRWFVELAQFMRDPLNSECTEPFLLNLARPAYRAYMDRKQGVNNGMEAVVQIQSEDWRIACHDWISRREQRKAKEAGIG